MKPDPPARKGDEMRQESRGKVTKLQGRVKEAAGIITGNRDLENEGARQRAAGAVQQSIGAVRDKAGDFIAEMSKAIRKS